MSATPGPPWLTHLFQESYTASSQTAGDGAVLSKEPHLLRLPYSLLSQPHIIPGLAAFQVWQIAGKNKCLAEKNNPNTPKPPSTSSRHWLGATALFLKFLWRNTDCPTYASPGCFLHMPCPEIKPATLVQVEKAPAQLSHLARGQSNSFGSDYIIVLGHLWPEVVFLLMLSLCQ